MKEKLENFDFEGIERYVQNLNPSKEFKEIGDSFKAEYKNWIQKWNNLQHKYESMAMWTKSFSDVSARFNEELVKIQNDNRHDVDKLL